MKYRQITSEERYTLGALRTQGLNQSEVARVLGRARSTISREVRRNSARHDGAYRPSIANARTNGRRSRSRRNEHFTAEDYRRVAGQLKEGWSPEQISGRGRRDGTFSISHETIYLHIWKDKRNGGDLYKLLRCAQKKRRKRHNSRDSRGRLAGKRHISERPASVETRKAIGHWEIDTVGGPVSCKQCILTLAERKSGYAVIGKLEERTVEETNHRTTRLVQQHPGRFKTITADNGSEFHGYADIEKATGTKFYFATPYHSWERGSNENLNGLIRQYLPKRASMAGLTQHECNAIARKLNTRPRKRLGYRTPEECFHEE
jgi:IS30 family transposase